MPRPRYQRCWSAGRAAPSSVRLREQHATRARLAGLYALPRFGTRAIVGERQAADGDLRLVLDLLLRRGRPIPVREDELRAVAREHRLELVPRVDGDGVRARALVGAAEEEGLEAVEEFADFDA